MKQHIEEYASNIKILIDNLDRNAIENATKLIEKACHNENSIFIIGNGGSAVEMNTANVHSASGEFQCRRTAETAGCAEDQCPICIFETII